MNTLPDQHNVLLVIGANQGDRMAAFRRCRLLLSMLAGEIISTSLIYDSSPWGVTDQPPFINQGIHIRTTLTPEDLLAVTQDIESRLGKNKLTHWGPRHIDIDIILWEDIILDTDRLSIPHPHMGDRRFVLIPLTEIAEDWIHPISRLSINQLLERCQDDGSVRIVEDL